jgi:1,4-alpha-glucan branching enzyme
VPRSGYEFGVPEEGFYEEILNTDSELFGGSNLGNGGLVSTRPIPMHGREFSIAVTLPPLAVVAFRRR